MDDNAQFLTEHSVAATAILNYITLGFGCGASTIAEMVFYDMEDRNKLNQILTAMIERGWLERGKNGVFRATEKGAEQIDRR